MRKNILPRFAYATAMGLFLVASAAVTSAEQDIERMVVISDHQIHHPFTRAYSFQNRISDDISHVAVRPPHSTLFGPFAMRTTLGWLEAAPLLVHLGDAADLSCPWELESFFAELSGRKNPWLFTPGNHDGYFTGNSEHKANNLEPWDSACGGSRLNKALVVETYLRARFASEPERDGTFSQVLDHQGIRLEAEGSVDADSPHRSFVIQRARFLTPSGFVSLIVLDTAQYENPPKYRSALRFGHKVAGITGEILEDQRDIATSWIESAIERGDRVLLAGHHPLKLGRWQGSGLAWFGGSKWIRDLFRAQKISVYLSAHTHKGGWRSVWESGKELNLASLVDWPLGWREIDFQDEGFSTHEVLTTAVPVPDDFEATCQESWQFEPGFGHYINYRNIPRTGTSGRYLQHYLLIAELFALNRAFSELSEPQPELATVIAEARVKFKEDLKTRIEVDSGAEIAHLRPLVEHWIERYESMLESASVDTRAKADSYHWCQLWWSAKADYEEKNHLDDATGKRPERRGWQTGPVTHTW